MNTVETVRRRVALAGNVTDAVTGKVMAGVSLSISDMPALFRQQIHLAGLQFGAKRPAPSEGLNQTHSREDGLFFFLDLPEGDYTIQASATGLGKRYAQAETKVSLAFDTSGEFKPQWISLSLAPTGVQGVVKSQKTVLVHASVVIQGSAESGFSDAQGHYQLSAIEPGQRTLLVRKQGFRPLSQTVSIDSAGQMVTSDFNLQAQRA